MESIATDLTAEDNRRINEAIVAAEPNASGGERARRGGGIRSKPPSAGQRGPLGGSGWAITSHAAAPILTRPRSDMGVRASAGASRGAVL